MAIISKLIDHLFLPPGIFILLLIFSLILLQFRKIKLLRITIILTAATLYLLSIEPVKDALIMPLEDRYPALQANSDIEADYIVILGGGTIGASPEEGGRGSLSPDALKRLYYGAYLHKQYNLPIIVTGGRIFNNDKESEARVAARSLAIMGIPSKQVLQEGNSRNTWENALLVKREISPGRVLLVTSAYHMARSMMSFTKNGINCIAAPTDYKSERTGYTLLSFLPGMGSFTNSYRALHEYIGYLYYSLKKSQ
ncbi:MAG TPA: YdcF family protein [Spirochaetales bacterium]|nr:YdcF family protein [Spirochaetales bacterium]